MNKPSLHRAAHPLADFFAPTSLCALLLAASAAVHGATPLPLPLPVAAAAASPVAPKPGAAPSAQPSGQTYMVRRGETLDKIIQKTLGDSPLRIELLRKAFIELNPQAFPGAQASRLRAEQLLQVPDAQQLLRAAAMPLFGNDDVLRPVGPVSVEERRRWVRFP
jgi:Tfp pilus assembly protein FimV